MQLPGLIFTAAVGGAVVALQAQLMGTLDRTLGTVESVFITYFGGGLLIGLVMLIQRGGNLGAWQQVPWYSLGSGALGLVIVGVIGYCAPRMGMVPFFTVLISAQFCLAALLDHFGWLGTPVRPLDVSRLAGMMTVMIGIWLIVKK